MKSVRQVAIADHLWDALERIAAEMGSDREALVNQALHLLARHNGYLLPAAPAGVPPLPPAAEVPPLPVTGSDGAPPPRAAVAEQVLETAARLEEAIQRAPPAVAGTTLVLVREDGAEVEVAKDRFVIGRGRHCDLVIDSGKVSREHAAVVREGGAWTLEDLGSSNGTWHRRARVQRRRIDDGDEYFICSEKLRCVLR